MKINSLGLTSREMPFRISTVPKDLRRLTSSRIGFASGIICAGTLRALQRHGLRIVAGKLGNAVTCGNLARP